MAESFLGDALNLGGSLYGYDQTQDSLKQKGKDIDAATAEAQGIVNNEVQFQPWGVTSQTGSSNLGPDGMSYNLAPGMQYLTSGLQHMGVDQLRAGMQSPLERQNSLYQMMNAAQMPEQQRQQAMMQQQLQSSGRSGMFSGLHGGTPEQLAYQKAVQEQQAGNWLGAGTQANQELMNQYTQGMGMLGASYDPMKMLMDQGNQGIAGAGQNNTLAHQRGGMMTDLVLGNMNANTNLTGQKAALTGAVIASMTGNDGLLGNFGDMIQGAARPIFDGAGNIIEGAWDKGTTAIKNWWDTL